MELHSQDHTALFETRAKAVLIGRFTVTNMSILYDINTLEVLLKQSSKDLSHPLPVNLHSFCSMHGLCSVISWCNCFPYVPYELFKSSCLPVFETGPNPISGTGLVPIGILVNTHHTEVTPGACLRAQQPSKSSVKHASHKAKAYRTGQSRRHTFRAA